MLSKADKKKRNKLLTLEKSEMLIYENEFKDLDRTMKRDVVLLYLMIE